MNGATSPLLRLAVWLEEARRHGTRMPEAMSLATADRGGRPAVRLVLCRGLDERGIVFYTDQESRKGRELRENARAAAAFYWGRTGRQVRIEGGVERLDAAAVDAYWSRRTRGKRLAALASRQSAPLAERGVLIERLSRLRARLAGQPVPRPPRWGGFRIVPDRIEFWTRRRDRLHERELYVRSAKGWRRRLLQP